MSTVLRLLRLVLIVAVTAVVLAGAVYFAAPHTKELVSAHTSDHEKINLEPLSERSYVYDKYGNVVATLYDEQNRAQVPLSQVPDTVKWAIIATEDEHFYQHKGVNIRAIGRALTSNIEAGGVAQGGSTITQQLVKNALTGDDKTLSRKLREAFLATELEKQMTKDEILERYLNSVYFGNGAYGVQAASELYFNKDVSQLGWAEGALLAALIRSPNAYDPFKNPLLAASRRLLVLRRLVETGWLTTSETDLLNAVPLPTVAHRPKPADDYFVELVKQQLLDDPRLGATPTARYRAVFGGGLRIHTTWDPIAQYVALQARDATMPDSNGDGTFDLPPAADGSPRFGTAAIASVEPSTGAVRVLVGGPGYDRYKYDLAAQGARQPGSSFKTFVLATAMEEGYLPTDSVDGSGPCAIPGYPKDNLPDNFGGSAGGVATIKAQTQKSSNCAFLRLGQIVGLDKVVETAKKMGITTPLQPVSSMPIGSLEVHPLDMAAAYSVLANDGVRNPPYFVDYVENAQGKVLFKHTPAPERVISVQSARLVNQILVSNVEAGTGTRAQMDNGQQAAGKTGTTNGATDIWFVGYTPRLATAVWMGSPTERIPLKFGGATGGRYPAATWGYYMNHLYANEPTVDFPPPDPYRGGTYLRMPGEQSSYTRRRPRRSPTPPTTGTPTPTTASPAAPTTTTP